MTRHTTAEKQEAFNDLKKFLRRGERIYCITRWRSQYGTARRIDLFVMRGGLPRWLSWQAAILLGLPCKGNGDGIKVDEPGMDAAAALVGYLGRKLYPNGIRNRKGEYHQCKKPGSRVDGFYAFQREEL